MSTALPASDSATVVPAKNKKFSSPATLLAALPSLVVLLSLLQQLVFLLPDIRDGLTESYEPVKTLRFIYTHGQAVHKWGPFPSFLFAPVYAILLGFAKLTHHLGKLSAEYPYGFDDPIRQFGQMILAARATVLLVAILSIFYLCRTLQRALNNTLAPVFALLLALTTSLVFLEPLADTKPDGMMVSLLICALANFAAIVLEGFTFRSALGLAFFYVASLSCKELTSTTLMLPYLGLVVSLLLQSRDNKPEFSRQLKLLLLSVLAVPVFYLLINVIYAPHAWHDRIAYVFGPLKDPAAWAAPGQTRLSYLRDAGYAILAALGWGGVLLFFITLYGTLRRPSRALVLLWLPFVGHIAFTIYLGGYMPTYFMIPLGPALAVPAAYVLAQMLRPARVSRLQPAAIALAAICLFFGFSAIRLFCDSHSSRLVTRASTEDVPPGATYNIIGLWSSSHTDPLAEPGSRTLDRRPLYQLLQAPSSQLPEYALIPIDTELWTLEMRQRPARAAILKADTNFDYSAFSGFEALGYHLDATVQPKLPFWLMPALITGSHAYTDAGVHVYRLNKSTTQQNPNSNR
ncbi:MAG TPA: hypothetical protein VIM62_13355 [Acidobacteriaceae bacterium]